MFAIEEDIPIHPIRLGNAKLTGTFAYYLSSIHWLDVHSDDSLEEVLAPLVEELSKHFTDASSDD